MMHTQIYAYEWIARIVLQSIPLSIFSIHSNTYAMKDLQEQHLEDSRKQTSEQEFGALGEKLSIVRRLPEGKINCHPK